MELSLKIKELLKEKGTISSEELGVKETDLHPVLLSLSSKDILKFEASEATDYKLTEEGESIYKQGSYEYNVFKTIPIGGIELEKIKHHIIGLRYCFKNGWLKKEGSMVSKAVDTVEDIAHNMIVQFREGSRDSEIINILKRRKFIAPSKRHQYIITKGPNIDNDIQYITELTSKILLDESYKSLNFKEYNFNSTGNIPQTGALHPLMKVKEEIKNIFLEMGFTEMNTSQYVESSFWNFDALFQPQQHPSRDAHDTFYMKTPSRTNSIPQDYLERVKHVHTNGEYGSEGHHHEWEVEEAEKNILRSHTTSVSAKYLYNIAKNGYKPSKLFSIDKVFRNEALDATHLAEFNQVEGVIVGKNLTIGNLMAIMEKFFEKLGIKKIKFKPAFNPYTEPSMEVFGYHEGLKKWIEVGNSGMFRPEMLRTMGFDEDVRAIGYGLSLERPTMIKYNINNIRDLVGPKVDFDFIKKSSFCYF
ncbi:putative phenylalanine--tRNA ligase alpha subunit [Nosema granulosis]|uniref:Probable phenylalanine--tRNA ligase alpha subunit n=1 Tax=Nosema granulosis TaxID=83296 RepID=A0A9P6L0I7_9MICR|nr:putative phenylalanine--tRNA ligase alpha subunit [Nosema granulosis]